jgi:hypothetical protein
VHLLVQKKFNIDMLKYQIVTHDRAKFTHGRVFNAGTLHTIRLSHTIVSNVCAVVRTCHYIINETTSECMHDRANYTHGRVGPHIKKNPFLLSFYAPFSIFSAHFPDFVMQILVLLNYYKMIFHICRFIMLKNIDIILTSK